MLRNLVLCACILAISACSHSRRKIAGDESEILPVVFGGNTGALDSTPGMARTIQPNMQIVPFSQTPSLASPPWPRWAHEHWIWENSGTHESAWNLVDQYQQHNIGVSALIIDRPWDTAASTFIPDDNLYPNFKQLIDRFHERNVKVLLWGSSLLEVGADGYQEGMERNYFVNHGRSFKWWAGTGVLLDYKNPEALAWWHQRMNVVLDMGIDGWKLDGTDPFIMLAKHKTNLGAAAGILADLLRLSKRSTHLWDEYRAYYYSDFLDYSRQRTGRKIVVMGRPVDALPYTNLRYPFAPYAVTFAAWVGDQDGDWKGFGRAIGNMKESTKQRYLSFGSDTGGIHSNEEMNAALPNGLRDSKVFTRWTQLSAFSSLFENGGSGEHRPWAYGADVENMYRRFANIHQALVPYIYSSTAWASEGRHSVYVNAEELRVRPKKRWYWDHLMGPNLFIATLGDSNDLRHVRLPAGEWIPFLNPTSTKQGLITETFGLDDYPAYIRNGAILPLFNTSEPAAFMVPQQGQLPANGLTVLVFPKEGTESFPVYSETVTGGTLSYTMNQNTMHFSATNIGSQLSWLRVQRFPDAGTIPAHVKVQGEEVTFTSSAQAIMQGSVLWVNLAQCGGGNCSVDVAW